MKPSNSLSIFNNTLKLSTLAAVITIASPHALSEIVSGELFRSEFYSPGYTVVYEYEDEEGNPYTEEEYIDGDLVKQVGTVNFHQFNSLGGMYTFDVTANSEYVDEYGNDYSNIGVGDSYIWIFRDDGLLDEADYVAENDDWTLGEAGESGSISSLDSFLSLELEAGSYFLAVGTCCEAFDFATQSQLYMELPDYDGELIENNYSQGTYQVSITQGVSEVPVPAAAWLFASALLGLTGIARRKK